MAENLKNLENLELQKYKKIMELAIHESDIYVWEYDVQNDLFIHQDRGLKEKYGIDPNEKLTSESFFGIVHPEHRKRMIKSFKDVIENGSNTSYDCKVNVKSKNQSHYQWFRYRATLVQIDGQKIVIGTAMCIDSFVRERELLTSLIDEAENTAKNQFAFLANMSHELRNPLNTIVGFADLIAMTENKEEISEYVKMMKMNSTMLMNLVNDILDFSKIEAGTMANKPELMDLSVAFTEITMSLEMSLTNPDIKFIVENPYKSCMVDMDRNRMAQILTNYVTNAFKYTERGTVTAGYEYINHGIKIYVKDTGIGIPKDKQDKVFSRFAKLDSYAKGNGLGLSIVKALTEAVGGKVGFTSEEGVGSTFWAWKPGKAEIVK